MKIDQRSDVKKRILIAEDEFIIAILYEGIVQKLGCEVVGLARSGKDAVKLATSLRPDIAFLDISMEHKTAGIDACRAIKSDRPGTKVYLITAYAKDDFGEKLNQIQYDGYIDKTNFEGTVGRLLR